MSGMIELFSGELPRAIGWTLLHLLWQGVVIAGVVAVALRLTQRRSAAFRYAIAVSGLLLIVVTAVATGSYLYRYASLADATTSGWQPSGEFEIAVPLPTSDGTVAVVFRGSPLEPLLARARTAGELALPWTVIFWLAGVLALSARLAAGVAGTRRLRHESLPATAEWMDRLASLQQRMRLSRPVRLLRSAAIEVPMVIGWFRPVVLVPMTAITGLSPQQLESILAHELAHIRRHDYLVNLLQTLAEIVFFYHPAVWWLSERVRIERENSCDDLAVSLCGNPLLYARALTELEALRPSVPQAVLAASGGSLRDRVLRLLRPESACSHRWSSSAPLLSLIAFLVVATPLALVAQIGSQPSDPGVKSPSGATPVEAKIDSTSPAHGGSSIDVVALDEDWELSNELYAGIVEEINLHEMFVSVAPPAPMAPPLLLAGERPSAPPAPLPMPRPAPSLGVSPDLSSIGEMAADISASVTESMLADFGSEPRSRSPRSRTRTGDGNDELEELIAMRNVGVNARYIADLEAAGYPNLTNRQLISMRAVGVTARYIDALRQQGIERLSVDDLIGLRAVGVTGDYIGQMRSLDLGMIDIKTIRQLRAVGVTPTYVRELERAGLTALSAKKLISMRAVGVTPTYISELKRHGIEPLSVDELIGLKAVGVTGDYIGQLRSLHLGGIDTATIKQLRAVGVTAKYVNELQGAGLTGLSANQLIKLRVHGVTAAYIREIEAAGFNSLSPDQLVRLKISGVDRDLIESRRRARTP
jgi:beta-lactamase regulating signal transducer with metallopeptidase domain